MDPIRKLCQVKNSFQKENINKDIPSYSSNQPTRSPRAQRKQLYTNNKEYTLNIERTKTLPQHTADPFHELDSIFSVRSSVVLANVDTVFNFSNQEDGYIKPQVITRDYKYVILDSDKGFLKYMEYRLPAATGFVDCLESKNVFINTNCDKNLVNFVLNISPDGVDLILSNQFNMERLKQALSIGGTTFIARVNIVDEPLSLNLMYAVSLAYSKFTLFKPFLENLNEHYTYIVAEEYLGNSLDILTLDFEKISVPESFFKYVQDHYDSVNNLRNSLNNEEYNMYRCKAIMNIY